MPIDVVQQLELLYVVPPYMLGIYRCGLLPRQEMSFRSVAGVICMTSKLNRRRSENWRR